MTDDIIEVEENKFKVKRRLSMFIWTILCVALFAFDIYVMIKIVKEIL